MRFSSPLLSNLMTRDEHAKAYSTYKKRKEWYLARKNSSLSNSDSNSDDEVDLFLLGKKGDDVLSKDRNDKASSSVRKDDTTSSVAHCNLHDVTFDSRGGDSSGGGHGSENGTDTGAKDNESDSLKDASSNPDSEWKDRIDPLAFERKRMEDYINKQKDRRTAYAQKYGPGRLVSSRSPRISTNEVATGNADEGKAKSVRDKVFGIVLKGSEMDFYTWLVKFANGLSYYCNIKLLIFENHHVDYQLVNMILNDEEKEIMTKARFEEMSKKHDYILKSVLYPLPVRLPGKSTISVRNIVKRLKPMYPWLEENLLCEYINAVQNKLSFNKPRHLPPSDVHNPSNSSGANDSTIKDTVNPSNKPSASNSQVLRDQTNVSTSGPNGIAVGKLDKGTQTDDDLTSKPVKKREQSAATRCYLAKKYGSFDSSSDKEEGPPSAKKVNNSNNEGKSTMRVLNFDEEVSSKEPTGDGKYMRNNAIINVKNHIYILTIFNFDYSLLHSNLISSYDGRYKQCQHKR